MSFAHEDLQVYQKGLECFGGMQPFLSSWNKRHAFVDHLARALESLLFNLVEATRLRDQAKKLLSMDYALGSTFESAACLDIATVKGLISTGAGLEQKMSLLEVCKMLIGLRNSWRRPRVAEAGAPYVTGKDMLPTSTVFHHETLDMYTVMLDFYRWFVTTESGKHLRQGFERSIDVLSTRVVLNIAEGNGRYAELSRQSFLDTANAAVAKLAVSLDMGVRRNVWSQHDIQHAKQLLLRVGQMTCGKDYGQ